jgi:hypothetical protein
MSVRPWNYQRVRGNRIAVQEVVPGITVTPYPFSTYREMHVDGMSSWRGRERTVDNG